jgi:membrane protease YdiL (CAAX protease family)
MNRSASFQKYAIVYFTVLAYLISWILWLPLYLPYFGILSLPVLPFHHALGAIGPFAAAFIVTYILEGKRGTTELAGRLIKWDVPVKWHLIAWLSPFALLLGAAAIVCFTRGDLIRLRDIIFSREFPQMSFGLFVLYNIFSFGYGEETGWRGFVLPRLQARHNALWASIILSIIWAGWHIPLFLYRPGYITMGIAGITGWLFSLITGSILLTWLYNSTRGSLLIVSIFHATIDVAFTCVAAQGEVINYTGMLITFWAIVLLFIKKPENLSDNKRQTIVQAQAHT